MTTGRSPSELMLKRNIRTRIVLIKSQPILQDEPHGKLRQFEAGDNVQIRNYGDKNEKWLFGTVISRIGTCNYDVSVGGKILRRHIDQIRPTLVHPERNCSILLCILTFMKVVQKHFKEV